MATTNENDPHAIPSPPSGERGRVRGRIAANQSIQTSASSALRPPSPPVVEKDRRTPQYGKHRARTPGARNFARALRKKSTEPEKKLWRLLRDRRFNEFKFRRQYACGDYFLDFYCTVAKLAVELDGGGHGLPDQREHDEKRKRFLAAQGVKVLRFWNHQLSGDLEVIRFEIWHALMERTGRMEEISDYLPKPTVSPAGTIPPPHPNPLPQGGEGVET